MADDCAIYLDEILDGIIVIDGITDDIDSSMYLSCGHRFHVKCIKMVMNNKCPLCRHAIDIDFSPPLISKLTSELPDIVPQSSSIVSQIAYKMTGDIANDISTLLDYGDKLLTEILYENNDIFIIYSGLVNYRSIIQTFIDIYIYDEDITVRKLATNIKIRNNILINISLDDFTDKKNMYQ